MINLSTYLGPEPWFGVKIHANRTHLSTAGYYFLMIFSELPLIGRV